MFLIQLFCIPVALPSFSLASMVDDIVYISSSSSPKEKNKPGLALESALAPEDTSLITVRINNTQNQYLQI